jgi:hypothetical protein
METQKKINSKTSLAISIKFTRPKGRFNNVKQMKYETNRERTKTSPLKHFAQQSKQTLELEGILSQKRRW